MTNHIPAIKKAFATLGVELAHPKPVTTAQKIHADLHAYITKDAGDPGWLAAEGRLDDALTAIQLKANQEALRTGHAIGHSERNLENAVASNIDRYLKQLAPVITAAVNQLQAANLPVDEPGFGDLQTAVRGRYADRLGQALDDANTLLTYSRLVRTLTRTRNNAAPLLDIDPTVRFDNEHNIQDRVDRLAAMTDPDSIDLIRAAAHDQPYRLTPVFTTDEIGARIDQWAKSIADAGKA